MYNLLVFVTMKNIISKFRASAYVSHFQSYFVQSFASYSSKITTKIKYTLQWLFWERILQQYTYSKKKYRNNYWRVSQNAKHTPCAYKEMETILVCPISG